MNRYTFRPIDIAPILSAENSITIQEDIEPVLLFNTDISALEGQPPLDNYWYFGDFVVCGYDEFLSNVLVQNTTTLLGDVNTLYLNGVGGTTSKQSVYRGVLWNQVASWQGISGYFYGYKLNRARRWVAQTPNYSLSSGWSVADGIYSHSSGTTELAINGAWISGNPTLRLRITFTGITSGSLNVELDNSGLISTIDANGTYQFSFYPDGLDSALYFIPTTDFNGYFDSATLTIEKYTFI